jgi:RNA polymerase-binding transcription factor
MIARVTQRQRSRTTRRRRPQLVTEFRRRLNALRYDMARTVATTDEELATLEAQQRGEIAENASTSVGRELLARLDGRARHELDEIEAAQGRLETGVFGACEHCHEPIPLARLRAMPTARRCATCQTEAEATCTP